ncbi:hypothetical protein GCM10011309_05150 [Litorimonas cladophorae]|uniref:Uncharacterized protein n=1 Tax=Litorimonas cladophorae TaxID=1220491 RepID=A0A918KCM7_9PROT|nr:hypothetical protein GCM10011309_05150 [Litorimonas cladophorae]
MTIGGGDVFKAIPAILKLWFGASSANPKMTTHGKSFPSPAALTRGFRAKTITNVSKYRANGMIHKKGADAMLLVM